MPRRSTLVPIPLMLFFFASTLWAGPYAPPAGQAGSEAIAYNDPAIVAWATGYRDFLRGPFVITNPTGPAADFGTAENALGTAGTDSLHVVSLGDGGSITLSFDQPIVDGPGFDLAVFENGFADAFLELAFVEVSSDGADFVRFPAVSLTPTDTQIGTWQTLDTTNLDNLAGKYRVGYGTPFDLAELAGSPLDLQNIRFVRIVDAIGTIDPAYATYDSLGNIVNDPWPTDFGSGGFDLDGVAVIHQVPEPATIVLALAALAGLLAFRRRR